MYWLEISQIILREGRVAQGILLLIIGILTIFAMERAKRVPEKITVRKIPAVDAFEEAIGRATEMDRPVFFTPGMSGLGSLPTLSALSILGYVARLTARYNVPIIVANRNWIVYQVAEGIVKQAYMAEGKPDQFAPEMVRYISSWQFGFTAGCLGIFQRERPAANFFMGYFYAESLELAESGYRIGAIQVAGTTATVQLPFFIAACDYVLIGEELYAAAAYVSRDPKILGVLYAHDLGKLLVIAITLIGALAITAGSNAIIELLSK